MTVKEEGVSLLRDMHKDNPLWDEVQENMKQEKLKYLGLIGHIGAGKDYVANFLAQNIERKCEVVKFATKLTQVVAAILGVDDLSLFQDREWKEKKIFQWQNKIVSARDIQIAVGTDIMRNIVHPNVWVTAFANQYNDPDTLYIISDLRFKNEFRFVQENNGIVVFIENLQAAQQQHRKEYSDGEHRPHKSEELTWSLYYEDIKADYRLLNSDYTNPKPLQDLLTFISML